MATQGGLGPWRRNREELLRVGTGGYRIRTEDLGLKPPQLEKIQLEQQRAQRIVLADIDQDGSVLSRFGPIEGAPLVSEEQFLPRTRFGVKLVALGGYVGVEKNYRGDTASFLNEVTALHYLNLARCSVPSVMDVDFDGPTLTFSYT